MRKTINLPGEDVLPPGALRSLTAALHDLYVGAGRPGTRQISKAINSDNRYPGMISDERVRQLLRGEGGKAAWLRYLFVVHYLVSHHTPALDRNEQEARFKRLYDAAYEIQADLTTSSPVSAADSVPADQLAGPLASRDQDRSVFASATGVPAGLELLKDSLRAHGGLPVHVVEKTARVLCNELQTAARALIADLDVPPEVLVEVKFMDGTPNSNYGGRPYRPARAHQLGLMLKLSMSQPFRVRAVAGMLPGIATHCEIERSFIVVDPTHPDVAPLYLHVTELHPDPSDEAKRRIRSWVNEQMDLVFHNAATAARAEREALGYRDLTL